MASNSRPKHGLYRRLRSRIAPLLARSRPAGSQCVVSAVSNTTVALISSDARDGDFEAASDTATPQPPTTGHAIATQGATAQNIPPLQEVQETAVHVSASAVVLSPSTASSSAQTHSSASSSPSAGREASQEPVDPLSLLPSGRRESLRAIALASQHSVPVADSTTREGPALSSASPEQVDTHSTEEVEPPYDTSPPEPRVSSPNLPSRPIQTSIVACTAAPARAQSCNAPLVAAIDRLGDRLDNISTTMMRGLQEINGSVVRIAGHLDDRHPTGVTTPQLEESPTASISYTTLDASAVHEPAIVHTTDGPPNPGAWPSPVPLATTPSPLGAGMDVAALQAQLSSVGGVPPNLLLAEGEVRLPAAGTEGRSAAPATRAAEEQATDEPRTHRLRAHIMLPPDDEGQASGCAVQPEPRIGLQDNRWNVIDDGPTTDANADNAADSVPLPAIPEVTNIAATPSNREVEAPTVRSPAVPPANSRPPIVAVQEARLEDAEEHDGAAMGTDVEPEDESSASAADPASPSPPAEDGSIDNPDSTAANAQAELTTEEDPIWTLIVCRPTSELFPGTLQLVIDVGTDGQVQNGDKVLFLGDLEGATSRLPGICAERQIEWSQLYLRIRKPVYKRQDSMLRVMDCLRPHLRCFLMVRFIMDEAHKIDSSEHFRADFSRLLFLSVEGKASKDRALLFPLNQLRYLNLSSQMGIIEMIQIIAAAQKLDLLQLKHQKELANRHTTTAMPVALPQNVVFPPSMRITTNDPDSFLLCLRVAESTTTDLRLRMEGGPASCSNELKTVLSRHDGWTFV